MNWNDLKYLLAVMRVGSVRQAARLLEVDKTTVSRRLAALEASVGTPLIERRRDGKIGLTEAGRAAAHRAEAAEDEIQRLTRDLTKERQVAGRVRLTAVPLVVNHLLLPAVAQFHAAHPDLILELIADARDLSLVDRDADVALRLARPRDGGQAVLTRRLGVLDYGCFAAKGHGDDLPWLGFEPRMQYLSHAAAIEQLARADGQRPAPLCVNDAETLLQAVRAGQGKSLLPRRIAAGDTGLREIDMPGVELPVREVWMLVRRDMRDLARVKAVLRWLGVLFENA